MVTESPSASEVVPGEQLNVDFSEGDAGVNVAFATTGGVFDMVTELEETTAPSSYPSFGVTLQTTTSEREKKVLDKVLVDADTAAPPTVHA